MKAIAVTTVFLTMSIISLTVTGQLDESENVIFQNRFACCHVAV